MLGESIMDRKMRCPVCQAAVPIVDDAATDAQRCPICQTTFVLPPRSREAEEGRGDDGDDADGGDDQSRR